MSKATNITLKAGEEIVKLAKVRTTSDGSNVIVPFPENNHNGFHFTQHTSGISNIRTKNNSIDIYNVKAEDLFDQELLGREILGLFEYVVGTPIQANVIFKNPKAKMSDVAVKGLEFDLTRLIEEAKKLPYGTGGIWFSHLRHNRLSRLKRYLSRGDTVIILTDEGREYHLSSIKPLFGMRSDANRVEDIWGNQPFARLLSEGMN